MKNSRIGLWIKTLRTTTKGQATGKLANRDQTSMCCLGIGYDMMPGRSTDVEKFWTLNYPREEFYEWLMQRENIGIRDQYGSSGDLFIDWGDLRDRNGMLLVSTAPASVLNDGMHLTFRQIADVVEHFGVTTYAKASEMDRRLGKQDPHAVDPYRHQGALA